MFPEYIQSRFAAPSPFIRMKIILAGKISKTIVIFEKNEPTAAAIAYGLFGRKLKQTKIYALDTFMENPAVRLRERKISRFIKK